MSKVVKQSNTVDEIQCVGKCRRILKKNNFYKSNRDEYINIGGYCNICKNCLRELTLDSNNQVNIDGIRTVLSHLNKPFLWDLFYKVNADKIFDMGIYLRQLNTSQYKNLTFQDSDKNETNINKEDESYDKDCTNDDIVKFWGKGFEDEEYEFLEEYYQELISIYDHSTPVQINLYKNMAKTQLLANKCLMKGDINGYEKNMNLLSKLQNDANIKPVQETGANAAEQSTFGVLIKKWENEKPIPEPNPEWEDVDGIKKYINTWFLGHLSKMLNIKNDYSEQYEKEMQEYRVDAPSYEEGDE